MSKLSRHAAKFPAQHQIQILKDRAVLLAWITGLLLLISVIWITTQPLQAYNLLRAVNSVLVNSDDSRRLGSYMKTKAGKAGLLGYWYSMYNSSDRMFVFGVFQNGILIPLGAVVSANDKVNEIIPLSAHAVQVYSEISGSIMQVYINRIEEAAADLKQGDRK